jgi:uncharacterized membrane protein YczE
VRTAIEAGKDISPELLIAPSTNYSKHLRLIIGILMIAFGIALIPCIYMQGNIHEAMAGLLFALPGAGLLLADYLIKKQQQSAE